MTSRPTPDSTAVFLNLPFDQAYEPLFVALIASLTAVGRKPRCVLEVPDQGQGRLARILAHMGRCAVSVHDLSRVGTPARFNMPFELGLAYATMSHSPQAGYHFVVLERVPHRLSRTWNDLSAVDALIHPGRPRQVIACILDALGTGQSAPSASEVYVDWRHLMAAARALKQAEGRSSLFTPTLFRRLAAAAAELAVRAGWIRA